MKSALAGSIFRIVGTILLFSLIGCDQESIATKKVTADKKAVGRWRLVSVTSGWTAKTDSPTAKIDMSISEQQQATVYKNGTEVSAYQYTFEETGSEILRLKITQQRGTSPIYLPNEGHFKVSSKQLVMDFTPLDGPAYNFERN